MPEYVSPLLLLLMTVMSLLLFVVMGVDKNRAKVRKRRVSETTLFLLALLGGGTGGTLGMYLFRHKTRHWYFVAGFPLAALLQWALWIVTLFA